jgi:hypothetical protein
MKRLPLACYFLITGLMICGPSAVAQIPSGRDVVAPVAYASLEPAARGMSLEIAVVLKIRPGYHVNAREVSADYLIPTDLKGDAPAGFKFGEVVYPKGTLETFAFSKSKPLKVYSDSVTLFVPVSVEADAPAGEQHLVLKLRYQACSTEICLPPVTKEVPVALTIVEDAKSAHPAHRELFKQPR